MENARKRVVLVPLPYQGHISPMLELGTVLHSKGFSITVILTKFNFPNTNNYPNFNFLSIPDNLSERDLSSGDVGSIILSLNRNCEEPLKGSLAQIAKESCEKVVYVIYDILMYSAGAAASLMKIPCMILRTCSIATTLTYTRNHHIQQEDYSLQDTVPGFYPLRFKDLPSFHFTNSEMAKQLKENVLNKGTSSAVIWNTMDILEESVSDQLQQHYQIPFFLVGPLYKFAKSCSTSLLDEAGSCLLWLNKQKHNSVIYVSLGSLASMDEKMLTEMAWGLAESKQPFMWVIRPDSVPGTGWLELLPAGFRKAVGDRGCIVKWAPQRELLAHQAVGGFWSHCGWNSTLESICEGVPLICQPCFGDQNVNARYLSYVWKVGLEVDENELKREGIERAVTRLMVEAEGKEMRRRALELKEKVKLCVKIGGSSYNSLNKLVEHINL